MWLLITAGPIKPVFEYYEIPVNWTLLVFSLVVLDILFVSIYLRSSIYISKEKALSVLLLLSFTLLLLISLIYTPSKSYGKEKAVLFGICILFFIYPLFIRNLNLDLLNKLYLFIIVPIIIWFILSKYLYYSPMNSGYSIVRIEFYDIRNQYLGLGLLICFFTILQVYLKKTRLLIALSLILLLGLGSRGSLLFLAFTLLIWKWKELASFLQFGIRISKRIGKIIFLSSFILIPLIYFKFNQITQVFYLGLYRFQSLIGPGTDISSQGRVSRMFFAIEQIFGSFKAFVFGNGIGSYGLLYTGKDVREYPHNLFLEIWFELGVFSLIIFLLFLITPFYFRRPALPKVLVICFLLHAMKSGDLTSLWILFFAYGLLIFNPEYEYRN